MSNLITIPFLDLLSEPIDFFRGFARLFVAVSIGVALSDVVSRYDVTMYLPSMFRGFSSTIQQGLMYSIIIGASKYV